MTACSTAPVTQISSTPVEKTPLGLSAPDPLAIKAPEWRVVTPANSTDVFKEFEKKKQPLALIALTPDGYQQLSVTLAEMRNLISTQRQIIIKYQNYYEPKAVK